MLLPDKANSRIYRGRLGPLFGGEGLSDAARYASLADIAHNPADLTGLFTTATGGVNAVPGDPVGFIADCAGSNGKTFAQVMAGVADVKSTLATQLIGTAPAATYNTTTGVGSVSRVDGTNQSRVGIAGPLTGFHEVDIENTGGLQFRVSDVTGANGENVTPGVRTKVLVRCTGNALIIYPNTGSGTATFTVHSVKKVPGFPYYQTTAGARPILARMPKSGIRNRFTVASATLASTTVAVTAVSWVLSFRGTGSVALSGAHTGNLAGTGASNRVQVAFTPTAGTLTLTVTGSVTDAQIEIGSTATAYQKVTNTYDVTEAGVPSVYALVGDGLSKCMVSDAVDPGTDKVTVVAGVRKIGTTARGIVAELGVGGSIGSWLLEAPPYAEPSAGYGFGSGWSVFPTSARSTSPLAPSSNVLTGVGDVAGDKATLYVNSVQAAQQTADQGTGNYGNHQLFLMARNQASLFFNGFWFGDHISWKNHAANDLAFIEQQMAKNVMGVTL